MLYKTSDVMKRAKSLANITNSDFITNEEDKQYLSSAWQNIYNKAIENGCKYWVKIIYVSNGVYLPDDFYQMCSLTTSSGYIIPRKTESDGDNGSWYEIRNNVLYINGCYSRVKMVYWPTPKELTYPLKPSKINAELTFLPVDYYNGATLSIGSATFITGEKITVEGALGYIGTNFAIVFGDDDGQIFIYNKIGNEEEKNGVYKILRDEDGIFYFITEDGLVHENGTLLSDEYRLEEYDKNLGAICKGKVYINKIGYRDVEGNIYAVNYDNRNAVINNGILYWLEGDYHSLDVSDDWYSHYGYGSDGSTLTYDGSYYYIADWIPDTLLDYPNNLLFEILCYSLAKEYLLKMEAPIDNIMTALAQKEMQFFETLSNDASYYRIRNAY